VSSQTICISVCEDTDRGRWEVLFRSVKTQTEEGGKYQTKYYSRSILTAELSEASLRIKRSSFRYRKANNIQGPDRDYITIYLPDDSSQTNQSPHPNNPSRRFLKQNHSFHKTYRQIEKFLR
jgi:hypothetical protein